MKLQDFRVGLNVGHISDVGVRISQWPGESAQEITAFAHLAAWVLLERPERSQKWRAPQGGAFFYFVVVFAKIFINLHQLINFI